MSKKCKGRAPKARFSGAMPAGGVTHDARRYVREWRAFAAPLCDALGGRLYGFDPGVSIIVDEPRAVLSFERWVVERLNAALSARRGEQAVPRSACSCGPTLRALGVHSSACPCCGALVYDDSAKKR